VAPARQAGDVFAAERYGGVVATYLEYLQAAMRKAQYERMEDGKWFASIPGFAGLWATGASIEEAREELIDTLDGWIDVHVKVAKQRVPDIDGVSLYDVPKQSE
jgi:predicted RNase H-like HicB family nuclease